jgi:hypothetical protein
MSIPIGFLIGYGYAYVAFDFRTRRYYYANYLNFMMLFDKYDPILRTSLDSLYTWGLKFDL